MIPYLARLLDMTINNGVLPADWKRVVVVPIHKGSDRSLVTNYRPVSLTSVVCKQMEHVTASYLRKAWDKNDWLYEGQNGFRSGYSCGSQVITVCQNSAESRDKGDRIDATLTDFSKVFNLDPDDWLLMKIAISRVDSRVLAWVRELFLGHTQRVKVGGQFSEEVRVTSVVLQGIVLLPLLFLA